MRAEMKGEAAPAEAGPAPEPRRLDDPDEVILAADEFAREHKVVGLVGKDGWINVSALREVTVDCAPGLYPSLFDAISKKVGASAAPAPMPAYFTRRPAMEQRAFLAARTPGRLHAGMLATASGRGAALPLPDRAKIMGRAGTRKEAGVIGFAEMLRSPRHRSKLVDAEAFEVQVNGTDYDIDTLVESLKKALED